MTRLPTTRNLAATPTRGCTRDAITGIQSSRERTCTGSTTQMSPLEPACAAPATTASAPALPRHHRPSPLRHRRRPRRPRRRRLQASRRRLRPPPPCRHLRPPRRRRRISPPCRPPRRRRRHLRAHLRRHLSRPSLPIPSRSSTPAARARISAWWPSATPFCAPWPLRPSRRSCQIGTRRHQLTNRLITSAPASAGASGKTHKGGFLLTPG
mmetsp:Transcript_18812/g.60506  ORF Transcript_18812/g.60506 Transcript_18812/m.60506 type:complete len:211 (-) Transcript_18812:343-975(-)